VDLGLGYERDRSHDGEWSVATRRRSDRRFSTKADLAAANLTTALDKDEKGNTPPAAEDRVWTATGPDGKYVAGTDCGGWAAAGNGRVGEAVHKNGNWTSLENEACAQVNRIYCFQQ
jgi:hypothetical protein